MKISPRIIKIDEETNEYQLTIKNSKNTGKVLLYKIKRSEPKLFEFSPKSGILKGDEEVRIRISLLRRNFSRARLLVKLVAIREKTLEDMNDFNECWFEGYSRVGEIKKLVELRNDSSYFTKNASLLPQSISSQRDNLKYKLFNQSSDIFSSVVQSHSTLGSIGSPSESSLFTASVEGNWEYDSVNDFSVYSKDIKNPNNHEFSISDADSPGSMKKIDINEEPTQESLGSAEKSATDHNNCSDGDQKSIDKDFKSNDDYQDPINNEIEEIFKKESDRLNTSISQKLSHQENHQAILEKAQDLTILSDYKYLSSKEEKDSDCNPIREDFNLDGYSNGRSINRLKTNIEGRTVRSNNNTGDFVEDKEYKQKSNSDFILLNCSSKIIVEDSLDMASLNDSSGNSHNCKIEIFGEEINDTNFCEVAESRIMEANHSKLRVSSLSVIGTQISDIRHTAGKIFAPIENFENIESIDHDLISNLLSIRSMFLEDNLKYLTIIGTNFEQIDPRLGMDESGSRLREFQLSSSLNVIDSSICRFHQLISLDLSHNGISKITEPLFFPNLKFLDLSFNKLKSLDFLQNLVQLKSLNASNNSLISIESSIYLIMPISNQIRALNLSHNKVVNDTRYVEAVMALMPNLKVFDGFDIDKMAPSYINNKNVSQSFNSSKSNHSKSIHDRQRKVKKSRLPLLPAEAKNPNSVEPKSKSMTSDFELRIRRFLKYSTRVGGLHYKAIKSKEEAENSSILSPSSSMDSFEADLYHNQSIISKKPVQSAYRSSHDSANSQLSSRVSEEVELEMNISPRSKSHNNYERSNRYENQGDFIKKNSSLTTEGHSPIEFRHLGQVNEGLEDSVKQNPEFVSGFHSEYEHSSRDHSSSLISDQKFQNNSPDRSDLGKNTPNYLVQGTSSSKVKRKSYSGSLISHWTGHKNAEASLNESLKHKTEWKPSTLQKPTKSTSTRRKSFGMSGMAHSIELVSSQGLNDTWVSSNSRGYHSEGEDHSFRKKKSISRQQFIEMQEDERYSKWHPRYRVPKPIFGYSKPFIHRKAPDQREHAPSFYSNVKRIREGFEKLPQRGTFTRSSKGLTAEWYPMDFTDLEAIRRQGYFHETIGSIQKDSYKDVYTTNNSSIDLSVVNPNGSTILSPKKTTRRSSFGSHISRQYRNSDAGGTISSRTSIQGEDDFSGFRKWLPASINEDEVNQFNMSSQVSSKSSSNNQTPPKHDKYSKKNLNLNDLSEKPRDPYHGQEYPHRVSEIVNRNTSVSKLFGNFFEDEAKEEQNKVQEFMQSNPGLNSNETYEHQTFERSEPLEINQFPDNPSIPSKPKDSLFLSKEEASNIDGTDQNEDQPSLDEYSSFYLSHTPSPTDNWKSEIRSQAKSQNHPAEHVEYLSSKLTNNVLKALPGDSKNPETEAFLASSKEMAGRNEEDSEESRNESMIDYFTWLDSQNNQVPNQMNPELAKHDDEGKEIISINDPVDSNEIGESKDDNEKQTIVQEKDDNGTHEDLSAGSPFSSMIDMEIDKINKTPEKDMEDDEAFENLIGDCSKLLLNHPRDMAMRPERETPNKDSMSNPLKNIIK